MRKVTLLIAACLMIGFAGVPATSADHGGGGWSDNGQILVGSLVLWWQDLGVSQSQAACSPGSDFDNIDGVWYDLDAQSYAGGGHDYLLTTDDPMDLDIIFYDEDCVELERIGACFIGPTDEPPVCQEESGVTPENTHYMLIHNFFGAGTYQISLTG